MLREWRERRDALMRIIHDHRTLCDAAAPDPVALSRSRWLISRASRQRTSWLAETVRPVAERLADRPGGAAWLAVEADTPAQRQQLSQFLSRWQIEAILADWSGYRRSGAVLHDDIVRWFATEEQAMRALSAEMDMAAGPLRNADQA